MSARIPWESLSVSPTPISAGRDFDVFTGICEDQSVIVKVARGDARLDAEASALARLERHGVTPRLIGLTQLPGGRPALVRAYVEAISLRTVIERSLIRYRWQGARRWNPPTRALVAALLDAVEHIHDAGLVHNDLKPDDIFVTMRADGRFDVMLVDLGLAAQDGHGGLGGTVGYAAPERLEGASGTIRSDIWALGAILFELLAGTRAYPSDQPIDARLERRHAIGKSPREGASRAWRALPPVVQGALEGALATAPKQRTKSIAALRRALDLNTTQLNGPPPEPSPSPRRLSTRSHFDPAWVAASVGTVLALALAWGPMSRALGLSHQDPPGACEAVQRRAASLCRGLSGEAACRAALSASKDCATRAELLGACEGP